ncbi:MAG: biopolymer transporter ExbD [Halioglobus sp.]|nr:biopolymer transporter ExbD [Halioglobus sp.]
MSRRRISGPLAPQDKGGEGDIDLTPMLDVVFIMLIFFIVTSTFVKEPGPEIVRIEATTAERCLRGTIIFAVDDLGKIHYDKKEIPLALVASTAEAAKNDTPKANFVIQVDAEASTLVTSELLDKISDFLDPTVCISTDEKG